MDLDGLITELRIRGFDQEKIDSALRCLVHVYAVQDCTSKETGGVLVEDIINSYPLEVAHAASQLFLDKSLSHGRDVYRVRWGFESAAKWLEKQLWGNASDRWLEFVQGLDERYLGFFLPTSYEDARVVTFWKARNDLKWFGVEAQSYGWDILRMIDDVVTVGKALDLVFSFRRFGDDGIEGERDLMHRKAFETLKERGVLPSEDVRNGINLWKFFSEYNPYESEIVQLMHDCGVTLDEVQTQIGVFYKKGLTTPYREGQYPPYLVLDKMKKQYEAEVRALLNPMEEWLRGSKQPAGKEEAVPPAEVPVSSEQ